MPGSIQVEKERGIEGGNSTRMASYRIDPPPYSPSAEILYYLTLVGVVVCDKSGMCTKDSEVGTVCCYCGVLGAL